MRAQALTVFKLLVNTCSFDRFSEQEGMRILSLLFVLKMSEFTLC